MQKKCRQCGLPYEITAEDLAFYDKVSTVINGRKYPMPPPTLCSACRRQRRYASRNERIFYKRDCDMCKKELIALYPADSPYKVYCHGCWWSDNWDPMVYGRDFDFNRPFFDQYSDLEKAVPHIALFRDDTMENCEYVNYGYNNKSCYFALGTELENVYYSHSVGFCKSSMDCTKTIFSELCYECIDCNRCYGLGFSQDCLGCSDSLFLKDCSQSRDCFCSAGLRNARFVFRNEQLSEEEYSRRMGKVMLTPDTVRRYMEERDALSLKVPRKYLHGTSNENVSGDYLDGCYSLKECYDCYQIEKSAWCDYSTQKCHDLYDCTYAGVGAQLSYECNGVLSLNSCKFNYYARNMSDCEYCQYILTGDHLFGCIGLSHKQYCILNKQYSKEKYVELVPKIIGHMMETQEYGEYFPVSISAYPYNETLAAEQYPMTRDQALARGYPWKDGKKKSLQQTYKIPPVIGDVPESIIKEVLACENCGKNYRIITQELEFYVRRRLPVPLRCPNCRHLSRLARRNPRMLYDRTCAKCKAQISTTYAPNRPEIVYCEACYLKEVY